VLHNLLGVGAQDPPSIFPDPRVTVQAGEREGASKELTGDLLKDLLGAGMTGERAIDWMDNTKERKLRKGFGRSGAVTSQIRPGAIPKEEPVKGTPSPEGSSDPLISAVAQEASGGSNLSKIAMYGGLGMLGALLAKGLGGDKKKTATRTARAGSLERGPHREGPSAGQRIGEGLKGLSQVLMMQQQLKSKEMADQQQLKSKEMADQQATADKEESRAIKEKDAKTKALKPFIDIYGFEGLTQEMVKDTWYEDVTPPETQQQPQMDFDKLRLLGNLVANESVASEVANELVGADIFQAPEESTSFTEGVLARKRGAGLDAVAEETGMDRSAFEGIQLTGEDRATLAKISTSFANMADLANNDEERDWWMLVGRTILTDMMKDMGIEIPGSGALPSSETTIPDEAKSVIDRTFNE
jgi:hypothetical protein